MKNVYKLILILLVPCQVLAQDTTVLKQQAAMLASAFIKGDYDVILNHTYPRAIIQFGGRTRMRKALSQTFDKMKAQGMVFESAIVGSPGRFYKSGTDIQCLLPESLTIKLTNGHIVNHSWLLAISDDNGKMWYFLDLNEGSRGRLHVIVPNLSNDIVIPEPMQPTYYSN